MKNTLLLFTFLLCFSSAHAVIVSGNSGTGNNNNTQAGLNSHISGESLPFFPYWNNLVRVSNASGVYLGFNATTQRGWVLSANHISPDPTTIAVAGSTYTVSSAQVVASSDLILYEIGGVSDPTLPDLPAIQLASILATAGETSLMFGRGFTNSTSSPYSWVNPGTDDANGMRWGSNTIEGLATANIGTLVSPNLQPYLFVDFDGPGDPGVTEFDAQGSLGDSGGGLFVLRSDGWELSGIAHFVDDGPDFQELIASGDGVTNPSEPGDFTAYSDIFPKNSAIDGLTGDLIPEPSTLLLTFSSLPLLLRRRR